MSACFVLIDFASRRIRSYAARANDRDYRIRKRCIYVSPANHMLDFDVVEANSHRDVAWQLSFDLCTDNVDRGDLQIRINPPNRLLHWRYVRDGRRGVGIKTIQYR